VSLCAINFGSKEQKKQNDSPKNEKAWQVKDLQG